MLENKDYCDYDTCVALYELGYDCYVIHIIAEKITLYEAQKWLREEKKIDVFVFPSILENRVRHYYAKVFTSNDVIIIGNYRGDYDSYEEALSEGIKEAVNILKENGYGKDSNTCQ